MANIVQARERGMASTGATGFDVVTTGATGGVGRGRILIRAVSLLGSRFNDGAPLSSRTGGSGRIAGFGWMPGGFGNGWRSGEVELGGETAGRRGKMRGPSVADSVSSLADSGVILGGKRRIAVGELRDGRTMRTVSFFGSSMGGRNVR